MATGRNEAARVVLGLSGGEPGDYAVFQKSMEKRELSAGDATE
jgi:hypothetical protein